MSLHEACIERGVIKDERCNPPPGEYKIYNILDYISSKDESADIDYDDNTKILKLWRTDDGTRENPINTQLLYDEVIELAKDNKIGWSGILNKENNKRWGSEPGFGINVGNINLASIYIEGKAIDYNRYELKEGNTFLYCFEIDLSEKTDYKVLVIPPECQWTQISCDINAHKKYDFIGHHHSGNSEMAILDRGRNSVSKTIRYVIPNKRDIINKASDNLKDLITNPINNIVFTIIPNNPPSLVELGYYKKYMKYKKKYLYLKNKNN